MKLIKITNDHYVVVDDSEIESGDFVYVDCSELEVNDIRKVCDCHNEQYFFEGGGQIHVDYCKKITHSTQPLEVKITDEGIHLPDWSKIKALSPRVVKELIGEVDAEKKAEYHYEMMYLMEKNDDIKPYVIRDYTIGYNQALEDNKEKKYTEEDMINAFREGTNAGALHERLSNYDNGDYEKAEQYSEQYEESFIQSLQPKKEWEIEEIEGKFKLK